MHFSSVFQCLFQSNIIAKTACLSAAVLSSGGRESSFMRELNGRPGQVKQCSRMKGNIKNISVLILLSAGLSEQDECDMMMRTNITAAGIDYLGQQNTKLEGRMHFRRKNIGNTAGGYVTVSVLQAMQFSASFITCLNLFSNQMTDD